MNLDEESGKYALRQLANRAIGPVLPEKYRHKLIATECDACSDKSQVTPNTDLKTKGRRISSMKE